VDPKVHGLCSVDGVEGWEPVVGIKGPVIDGFLNTPDLISLRKEDLRIPVAAFGRAVPDEAELASSGCSSSEDPSASESGVERPNLILSARMVGGPKPGRLIVLVVILKRSQWSWSFSEQIIAFRRKEKTEVEGRRCESRQEVSSPVFPGVTKR
jgi:hypothetical protein